MAKKMKKATKAKKKTMKKKVMKKKVRNVKKVKKVMGTKRKSAITKAVKTAKEKLIGKVVHFYDKIGVAIIDLKLPLSVGDTVTLKKGEWSMPQRVHSMQIEHLPVNKAKKGDIVGMKVDYAVREGTLVVPS